MNSEQAFETLFSSVAAALNESLARHAQAALKGDLKALDAEADWQRKLVAARKRLRTLRNTWPLPVGEPLPDAPPEPSGPKRKREPRPKKLKRGQKTPQGAYILPILQALDEMGGRGVVANVLHRVGQIMADELNEHDRGTLKSGGVRWWNTAQWARNDVKQQGLLAADSPRGTWAITEQGRVFLHEQRT